MIQSKNDYKRYVEADRIALGIGYSSISMKIIRYIYPNPTWKFQKKLRKLEYYKNCKKGVFNKLYYYYLYYKFLNYSQKLGFTIPLNVFGSGLAIVHVGTIVVNKNAKIGKNCRIQVCTNIGASGGSSRAPIIGDNVYIAPGVKIYGEIVLGNNIAIAANSSVNKSFLEANIMIAGSPAKKIKDIDILKLIPRSKDIENVTL